ncbi:GGDEF domain-containing protein [Pseudoxanthomonas sp. NC8]|nr:GGDEF domain-containing protein [Pseudoxanthomonas sp. NC8]
MVLGAVYATSQWLKMRRAHSAQSRQIDALEHEKFQFQKLAMLDSLTKVLNRHGINRFIAALRITGAPASVIVIDVDYFKRINDRRGHDVGDRVLRAMGEILVSSTRNTDAVGRWGGEEFVLVCPGASLGKRRGPGRKAAAQDHGEQLHPRRSDAHHGQFRRGDLRCRPGFRRGVPPGRRGALPGQGSWPELRRRGQPGA